MGPCTVERDQGAAALAKSWRKARIIIARQGLSLFYLLGRLDAANLRLADNAPAGFAHEVASFMAGISSRPLHGQAPLIRKKFLLSYGRQDG